MKLLRWLEGLSGVLTLAVGGATLAYLLFVPVYRGTGCATLPEQAPDCQATYATLLNGAYLNTQLEVALVALLVVGAGGAALWHARTGQASARITLWVTTGLLTLWTICPLLLPGVLLPTVVLALLACVTPTGLQSNTVT